MAMSTTTTACLPHYNRDIIPRSKPTNITSTCTLAKRNNVPKILRFIVRSSDASTTTSTDEKWEGGDSESGSVEVAKGPPSLISALNVEKAFRGIAITDVDHYGRLGLRRGCSYELVGTTYKAKLNELSSRGLDEKELSEELDRLTESYRILSTKEERRLYDWSLARSESPDRYAWPYEGDPTQVAVKGTPPAQEPEDFGPTRAVGYFVLGATVVAAILSIVLNQL